LYAAYKKNVLPTFSAFDMQEKQTEFEISNTADNDGITQLQARDTRYRRMQEVNRLCVNK